MKKIVMFLSVVLAVSMIFTSAFAATASLEDLIVNGFPMIGDSGYDKHVIYSGLPETGTSDTLANGVSFLTALNGTALQTVNSAGVLTTSYKPESSVGADQLILQFGGYPVRPSTHKGIVCYEWKVRFNTALPSKIEVESRDCDGQWAIAKQPAPATFFGLDKIHTIGIVYNTITGEWKLTKDGVFFADSYGYYGTFTGTGGLQAPYVKFTLNNTAASVDVLEANMTYYEKTDAPYAKVLFSGVPDSIAQTTNDYGVTFLATNATVTDGKLVETTGAKTYMSFNVNSTRYPNGGKLYWEYTFSFSTSPTNIMLHARNGSDWTISKDVKGSLGTLYANQIYRLGLEYDIASGNWVYLNNGTPIANASGTIANPATGFQSVYLDIAGPAAMKFTISDMKLTYTANSALPDNTYLSGVDYTSRKTWSQGKGVTFDAFFNGLARINNYTGKLVAKNADGYELQNSYARLYYRFDTKPTTATHRDHLYFEFTGNFSATPAKISIGAQEAGQYVLANDLNPNLFSDNTKEYTVALVYNVTSGEWYILVDGEPANIKGKVSDVAAAAGISNFYFEWHPADKADALTVTDVKAGYVPDTDSVGSITIEGSEASLALHKMPAYSSINDDVTFIVASYNDDNELIAIEPTICNLTAGDNTIKANVALADGATTVKVFVWDGINRFATPLAASVSQ